MIVETVEIFKEITVETIFFNKNVLKRKSEGIKLYFKLVNSIKTWITIEIETAIENEIVTDNETSGRWNKHALSLKLLC